MKPIHQAFAVMLFMWVYKSEFRHYKFDVAGV